ncbi:MAG: endopeptidase La [Bacillota bacterium]
MSQNLEVFPLLPLRGMVVFPYMVVPLDVGREKSLNAIEEAMLRDRQIVVAAQKDARTNDPAPEEIYSLGTLVEIKQLVKLPEAVRVLVEGLARVKLVEYLQEEPYYRVGVVRLEEEAIRDTELEALMRHVLSQFEQYVKLGKNAPAELLAVVAEIEEPGRLADTIASHLGAPLMKTEDRQALLEAVEAKARLEKLSLVLAREIEILEMERKIQLRVKRQMEKSQKEYYLREQMKAIQKELGEYDERAAEAEELRERLAGLDLPEEVRQKAEKEIERLERMPPLVAEAVVVRNYLDWLLSLPWRVYTEDRLDLEAAERILEEDHYGLEKVKERILEYLAVCQLTKRLKGPILCLVGPPGVGKTSLAKSIARALKRRFVRFSLGGVRDEAEIRGHRRTYVGAMPGRIIQAMRQAGSSNPVFLLDEIDKMSMDFRGDPSAALLEVLDPEQNGGFSDHYLEVPYDLSRVFFITTANTHYGIPRPLLDRMETIVIPGYTEEEKIEIARRHLWPKQLIEHGLAGHELFLSERGLRRLIREYTREAGVRELERRLAAVCRHLARQVVKGRRPPIRVTAALLPKYLGPPQFRYGTVFDGDRVGVATGLAWTEAGGEILNIEVSVVKGKGQLILTGKLGEVMRESAQAALSYIRSCAREFGIKPDFHESCDLHIHLPEGAIPKDGPSAGIAMATAIVSALTCRPVRYDVAMTGEITLCGRVLAVGGLKEKILAAHRAGIATVVLPKENEKDLEEIPENVMRKLRFVLVANMREVLAVAFLGEQQSVSSVG